MARAGIARGFQELRLFNRLSARDNIEAAIPGQRGEGLVRALIGGRGLRKERDATTARSGALLRELMIELQGHALAEQLSYGQQKLLSLGRLLATEAELLLLDEPTSGLSPDMINDFCTRMRALTKVGKTILLIEHNVEIVMQLSDWVVVMHQGTMIAEGKPKTCGTTSPSCTPISASRRETRMLNVEKLDAFYGKKQVLFGIDIVLAGRRIAALIGPNGAGKSTVLRAVFGLGPVREGTIRFNHRDLSRAAPPQNIAAGIAYVPQGARVFRDLTVFENLRMGGYTVASNVLRLRCQEAMDLFPILRERKTQKASALSGGERRARLRYGTYVAAAAAFDRRTLHRARTHAGHADLRHYCANPR